VRKLALVAVFFLSVLVSAQEAPKPPAAQVTPPVKVNVLNVCTPSAEEQTQIKSAFSKVSAKHGFARDFEISRGRTTLQNAPESKFVRLRRDFPPEAPLMTAQYSMSTDPVTTIEILVLRMRDPSKEFHELSFEDRVSTGAAAPSAVLGMDTPVTRIRLERFSKGSIVLARCEGVDQSAYDPLFREATEIMAQYRKSLGLRDTFKSDINWLGGATPAKASAPPTQKKPQ
jgi:hypothetical protein